MQGFYIISLKKNVWFYRNYVRGYCSPILSLHTPQSLWTRYRHHPINYHQQLVRSARVIAYSHMPYVLFARQIIDTSTKMNHCIAVVAMESHNIRSKPKNCLSECRDLVSVECDFDTTTAESPKIDSYCEIVGVLSIFESGICDT